MWDAEKHGADNPFLNLFTSIDIVLVFQGVLSLLALIFAYDALAGERERGTLRLVLTHPIQRGYILLAKYISAMLCLLVAIVDKPSPVHHLADNIHYGCPEHR